MRKEDLGCKVHIANQHSQLVLEVMYINQLTPSISLGFSLLLTRVAMCFPLAPSTTV